MAFPAQVLSLLLLMSFGLFLWQPTVIFFLEKYSLSCLITDQAGQDGVDSKPIHFGNCLDWTGFQKVVPTTYMSCRIKISSNYPSELC